MVHNRALVRPITANLDCGQISPRRSRQLRRQYGPAVSRLKCHAVRALGRASWSSRPPPGFANYSIIAGSPGLAFSPPLRVMTCKPHFPRARNESNRRLSRAQQEAARSLQKVIDLSCTCPDNGGSGAHLTLQGCMRRLGPKRHSHLVNPFHIVDQRVCNQAHDKPRRRRAEYGFQICR
jgi:hypothetical protein